jgi:hypothetical protein
MPKTREIPRPEWASFLAAFSRMHRGWRVRIEVFGADIGAQEEAELPLMGVIVDPEPAGMRVTITLGLEPDDHVSHSIEHPTRIRLAQTDEGADQALEIEAKDGAITLVRFLSPALPETVDGMVP